MKHKRLERPKHQTTDPLKPFKGSVNNEIYKEDKVKGKEEEDNKDTVYVM